MMRWLMVVKMRLMSLTLILIMEVMEEMVRMLLIWKLIEMLKNRGSRGRV